MSVKISVTKPKVFENMKKNAEGAKQEFLKQLATETKKELMVRTPKDTGRSSNAIIEIVEDDSFFVGWVGSEYVIHLATLNYGSTNNPDGWLIKAKNAQTLIFPKEDKEYNLPTIQIDGKEFYIAKQVHHPYQKGLKFIEGTVEEIRRLVHSLAKQSYFNTLKGGGQK